MTSSLRLNMRKSLARFGRSIAARLYCFAILSIVAVAVLAISSSYFAQTTETAAVRIYDQGFRGTLSSARLGLLLEQHRRIVESMPSEVDRKQIDRDRRDLDRIQVQLGDLIKEIAAQNPDAGPGALERRIAVSVPYLFEAGDKVIFYAYEFAQDKATEKVEDYTHVADGITLLVNEYRDQRQHDAESAVAGMLSSAKSLKIAVLICALAAFVLTGPIGLAAMHRVLSRLGEVTRAMGKLARHDTSAAVPYREADDEIGEMARAVGVFKENAIQLISREDELRQLNRRIDVALNNMTHGLCMVDAEQKLIVCNAKYRDMYGLAPDEVRPGTALAQIESRRAAIGSSAIASPEQAAVAAQSRQEYSAFTQELMDGRFIAVSLRPMADGGWVAVHEDITERRRAEAEISHLARHDLLTDLPNRVQFRERLEAIFAKAESGHGCAVLCLDLDQFKSVNDTFGHTIGDALLKKVAARLRSAVQPSDILARIGGDEFALVQTAVTRPEQCGDLAARIIEGIGRPYEIDGRSVTIGISVGIAIAPQDGSDPEQLLKNATMALYLAKGEGRGTHRFFEREMDRRLQARRALEIDLRSAIAKGEFELYYQPIVRLSDGQVSAFEALARWNHPQRGQIPPLQFISLAEELGLIVPLGEWVLRTACAQAAKWSEPVGVSVNLSAVQFKSPNLVQVVLNALAASALPPSRLDLEITESVLLQDEANTLATLHRLRNLGARVSMDDFGTGYSSLAYLRSFPFDKIKIDRSFVRDMPERADSRAIIRAVTSLAVSLKIGTVIEGIETEEQLAMATAEGCDEAQGFLFSKPMPEREVAQFLLKPRRVSAAA
ncbi:MAG TPA: EAL domain-containing protein [Xanthobacteraceae bacterium]|nr:EAL domain-containing protein [Xanthobacteraceae bacterium]